MESKIQISDLAKVVKESNLPEGKAAALEAAFMPFYEQVAAHCETAFSIKVTNIAQVAEMGRAKKTRLALRDIRTSTETERKRIKEDALREGQAIDKIAKFLFSVIEPMEKHLENQEKYGERLREQLQNESRDLRTCEFGKYIEFLPAGIDLGLIGDEDHARLLHMAKQAWNAREAEKQRLENERIEKEQREAAERARILAEIEMLKVEAAKVEAERAKEREVAAKAQREADAAIAAERAATDKLRREAAEKEQAERERMAAENRAKMEADNAERERVRKEQETKEAAEKAAREAPDREKMLVYAESILDLKNPQLTTESAIIKFGRAKIKISEAIAILQN